MADYHGVLRRTLSGFGDPGPELRAKVYERARATIVRQLDATQPPLPDAVKERQIGQLDQAILEVEAEYGGAPAPVAADEAAPAPETHAEAQASAEAETPTGSEAPEPAPETAPVVEPPSPPEPDVVATDPDVADPNVADPGVAEPDVAEPAEPDPIASAAERIEAARDGAAEALNEPTAEPIPELGAGPEPVETAEPSVEVEAPEPPRVRSFVDRIQEDAGVAPQVPREDAVPVVPTVEPEVVDTTLVGPAFDADAPSEPVPLDPVPPIPFAPREPEDDAPAIEFGDVAFERAARGALGVSEAQATLDAASDAANDDGVPRVDPLFAQDDSALAADPAPAVDPAAAAVAAPVAGAPVAGAPVDEIEDASKYFNDPALDAREAESLAAPPVPPIVERPKRGRGVLWTLLLIALVAIAAVIAWPYRGTLLAALGQPEDAIEQALGPYVPFIDDPNDPTRPRAVRTVPIRPTPEPEQPVQPEAPEPKLEQRLGADGEEVQPAPTREPVNTLPTPATPTPITPEAPEVPEVESTVPVVPVVPAPEPETTEPVTPEADAAEPETEGLPDPALPDPAVPETTGEAPADTDVAVADPPGDASVPATGAPIAQRAALIEEPAAGETANASVQGQIVWTLAEETDAGGTPQKVIRGRAEINDKGLVAIVSIKRNEDRALTASHLIELVFAVPDDFDGNGIEEVQKMEMKPSPQPSGSALVGVPVKIAPGIFFIALNNLPAAREANETALRTNDIMDIAVQYATGRLAVLRLEKGTAGQSVFDQAFAAWEAG